MKTLKFSKGESLDNIIEEIQQELSIVRANKIAVRDEWFEYQIKKDYEIAIIDVESDKNQSQPIKEQIINELETELGKILEMKYFDKIFVDGYKGCIHDLKCYFKAFESSPTEQPEAQKPFYDVNFKKRERLLSELMQTDEELGMYEPQPEKAQEVTIDDLLSCVGGHSSLRIIFRNILDQYNLTRKHHD